MNEERVPPASPETPDELRGLRLGRPHPGLRARTLGAVREALEAPARPSRPRRAPPRPWWREWQPEWALAAGIVLCLAFIPMFHQVPEESTVPRRSDLRERTIEPEELEDLAPYTRRLASVSRPTPRRHSHDRYDHDRYDTLDWNEL